MGKIALILALLSACAPTVTQIGPAKYAITECRTRTDCFEAAKEQCPHGFDIEGAGTETRGVIANRIGDSVFVTPVNRSELVVECSE